MHCASISTLVALDFSCFESCLLLAAHSIFGVVGKFISASLSIDFDCSRWRWMFTHRMYKGPFIQCLIKTTRSLVRSSSHA